ncbi:MAG TPA: hypothetical protein VM870_02595, partial [Pyrinomonadaceae bacterium]|nr:hypothetical protein [Pyrinomonadaceae bacterium]
TDDAPARYCYIVAKFVFFEDLRRRENDRVSLETLPPAKELRVAGTEEPSGGDRERLLDCLERCLQSLEPERRELILQYYGGERRAKIEGRRRLAERYGASVNALSIRACRIRQQLEKCVRACSEAGG